jgi:hypothetical protein
VEWFLPVEQERYFFRKLIVISHSDEVIQHNLCPDWLELKLND